MLKKYKQVGEVLTNFSPRNLVLLQFPAVLLWQAQTEIIATLALDKDFSAACRHFKDGRIRLASVGI